MKALKQAEIRTEEDRKNLTKTVEDMIETVKRDKDEALRDYSKRFDKSTREKFRVPERKSRRLISSLQNRKFRT